MNRKAVALLSGGADSSTLLYKLHNEGYELLPLFILYGQKHRKEVESAGSIAESLGLNLKIIDLTYIKDIFSGSALTSENEEIPEGHYTDESMKATIVPNRNMVFISLAGAYAVSKGCNYVAYAAHAGDHSIYPDCRPEFAYSINASLMLGTDNVSLLMPFINITKADIVKKGLKLGVPFSKTWSCYLGKERPCLRCGTCIERLEAFKLNDTKDPLLTNKEWLRAIKFLEGTNVLQHSRPCSKSQD